MAVGRKRKVSAVQVVGLGLRHLFATHDVVRVFVATSESRKVKQKS